MKNVFKISHTGSGHGCRVQRKATLNTDTWDDELHADSRLETDGAKSSIRYNNSSQVVSVQDFTTSAKLVKNAVTFAAGFAFSIVLTAL